MKMLTKHRKFRKLDQRFGKEAATEITDLIDISMEDFKSFMNEKFETIDNRIKTLQWVIIVAAGVLTLVLTILSLNGS